MYTLSLESIAPREPHAAMKQRVVRGGALGTFALNHFHIVPVSMPLHALGAFAYLDRAFVRCPLNCLDPRVRE
jgi:hypothetical protein